MDAEPGAAQADGPGEASRRPPDWPPAEVRALRERLGDSQQSFAERLGTRQQTVSEWERGASRPRRMAQRLLSMLAEEAAHYEPRPPADGAAP